MIANITRKAEEFAKISRIPRLALRLEDAAKAISISPRTLAELVKENAVPHVRIGRSLLFPVHLLRKWLTEKAGEQ